MPRGFPEPDHHHRFVRRRDPARDERVRRIDRRHALEIDVGLGELRTDVVHVVRHPPQDGVGHRLRAIAAVAAVAMQLLDPFEIDDGYNADLEIGMLRDIDLVGHDGAVQAFIKQQIGRFRQRAPFGKRAGCGAVQLGLVVVVDVMTRRTGAGFAVVAKHPLQLLEQVGFGTEMAEMLVAALGFLRHFRAHLETVVAMEGVALDIGRRDLFAAKDVLERLFHRRRAGARRTRDRYDGMTARHHGLPRQRNRPRRANSGASLLSNIGSIPS